MKITQERKGEQNEIIILLPRKVNLVKNLNLDEIELGEVDPFASPPSRYANFIFNRLSRLQLF